MQLLFEFFQRIYGRCAPLRRHRNPQTRAHAAAMARELATLSVRLHAALVQAGLRARVGG